MPHTSDRPFPADVLDHLFEVSSEAVAVAAMDGAIVAVNDAFCRLTGYAEGELVGRTAPERGLVEPAFADGMVAAVQERGSVPAQVTTVRTKSGERRDVRFSFDIAGSEGGPLIVGRASDVTDQLRMDRELRRSEQLFRSVAETAVDAIISADPQGRITFFNRAAERVFGYRQEQVLGRSLTCLMPERFHEPHISGLARFLGTGEMRLIGRTIAVEGLRADGTEFPVEISLSESSTKRDRVFTAIIRDLTERDAAERALRELAVAKERQRLLDRTVGAVEGERKRLAGELHDGPIQHLAAISMRLHGLGASFDPGDAAARERLSAIEEQLGAEIAELRSMMGQLVPTVLEARGLAPALEELAADVDEGSGMRVVADMRDVGRLTAAAETALYRIAQEALTNAMRHAGARAAQVALEALNDHVVLSVTDDGKGFDVAAISERSGSAHFGLAIMRERAEMVGGTLVTQSEAGRGTRVVAQVPRHIG